MSIDTSDVCLQMGFPAKEAGEEVLCETRAVMAEAGCFLRPRFCYFVAPDIPRSLHPGYIIGRQLQGSEAYALFIATAGTEYDDFARHQRQHGDLLRQYIADALGSVVAERCADAMEQHLQTSIDKLLWHHTNRFSPGYCGWPVDEQQPLFSLFRGHTCGVTLTSSSLMLPVKSVSGIVGLGAKVRRKDYTCHLCNYAKCYKRHTAPART